MLRDDVVALLGKRLGSRIDLDASIVLEMRAAQETLLEGSGALLPWFLLSAETTLVATADVEAVALPSDFLGMAEDHPVWLIDPTASPTDLKLAKRDYSVIRERYQTSTKPVAYAQIEGYLLLRPIPLTGYSLKLRYYQRGVTLSSNIENIWLKYASDLMLAEVGAIMAGRYLQNAKLEAQFQNDVVLARSRLLIQHERRLHENRSYSMGED